MAMREAHGGVQMVAVTVLPGGRPRRAANARCVRTRTGAQASLHSTSEVPRRINTMTVGTCSPMDDQRGHAVALVHIDLQYN